MMPQKKDKLRIAMLGHKRIPSREGGVEIVVGELATRMVAMGHRVTCYNRRGHHVAGKEFSTEKRKDYQGVRLKRVFTIQHPADSKNAHRSGFCVMRTIIFR